MIAFPGKRRGVPLSRGAPPVRRGGSRGPCQNEIGTLRHPTISLSVPFGRSAPSLTPSNIGKASADQLPPKLGLDSPNDSDVSGDSVGRDDSVGPVVFQLQRIAHTFQLIHLYLPMCCEIFISPGLLEEP